MKADPTYLAPADEPPLAWCRLALVIAYGAWWHLVDALLATAH